MKGIKMNKEIDFKDIDRETVAAVLHKYADVSNEYSIGLAIKRMMRDKIPESVISKVTPIIRESQSDTGKSLINLYLNEKISFDTMVIKQIENSQDKVGELMSKVMPIIVEAIESGEMPIEAEES